MTDGCSDLALQMLAAAEICRFCQWQSWDLYEVEAAYLEDDRAAVSFETVAAAEMAGRGMSALVGMK